MSPLVSTNPFVKDPQVPEEMLRRIVLESSYFQGARGVRLEPAQRPPAKARRKPSAGKRRRASRSVP